MLFSVIIPLYNKANYIEAALRSVLAQQEQRFEIIVVDDGSTDDGAHRVEALKHPRLKLVRQSNSGVSAARNRGIQEASAQYLAFLDADDCWEPEYLSAITGLIDEFPDCGMYATHFYRFQDNGARRVDNLSMIPGDQPRRVDRFFEYWGQMPIFCTCSVVLHASLMQESGICFPEGEQLGEDQDVWFRIAERGPIAYLPKPLVGYRVGVPGSSTMSYPQDVLPSIHRLHARYRSRMIPSQHRAAVRRLIGVQRIHIARMLTIQGERGRALRLLRSPFCLLAPRYFARVLLAAGMPAFIGTRLVALSNDVAPVAQSRTGGGQGLRIVPCPASVSPNGTSAPSARSPAYQSKPKNWPKIKKAVRVSLERGGTVGTMLLTAYRRGRERTQRARRKMRTALSPALHDLRRLGIDVQRVHRVRPSDIRHCARNEFGLEHFQGRVIAGDWDLGDTRFEDLDIYLAMKHVCGEGGDWKQTAFYGRMVECVYRGEPLWGCTDGDDIDRRLRYIEKLYWKIKQYGYKSQSELRRLRSSGERIDDGEVAVCVARDGRLLFSDGAHRLAAAKLLQVPEMPVQISVRHPEWLAFRRELLRYARDLGGTLHQPAPHPDLDDIPADSACEELFAAIRKALPMTTGRILDLGAGLGFYCHRFEDAGFECCALETAPRALYFLRRLKTAAGRRFEVLDLESASTRHTKVDVVLMLSALDFPLHTEHSFAAFLNLLGNLQTDELFVSIPRRRLTASDISADAVMKTVQAQAKLPFRHVLHDSDDGASLYRLSRTVPCTHAAARVQDRRTASELSLAES